MRKNFQLFFWHKWTKIFPNQIWQFIHQSIALVEFSRKMLFPNFFWVISAQKKLKNCVKVRVPKAFLRTFSFKAKNFSKKGLNQKSASHELWRIQKKLQLLSRSLPSGVIRAERCAFKLKYEKIKKTIFSIENAYISQSFLLDKLVSRQGL